MNNREERALLEELAGVLKKHFGFDHVEGLKLEIGYPETLIREVGNYGARVAITRAPLDIRLQATCGTTRAI